MILKKKEKIKFCVHSTLTLSETSFIFHYIGNCIYKIIRPTYFIFEQLRASKTCKPLPTPSTDLLEGITEKLARRPYSTRFNLWSLVSVSHFELALPCHKNFHFETTNTIRFTFKAGSLCRHIQHDYSTCNC